MSNSNEYTSKFNIDISDLKKGIQQANQIMKLANSEFKAATGGMDDWSKSADGLSAKLKQLNTVHDAQKTKMEVLCAEYARVVAAEGEDSKGAQDLQIRMNNLQSEIGKTSNQIKQYSSKLSDLSGNEKGLTEKLADQKKELSNLKTEYVDATAKYGKNSDEAKALTKQIEQLSREIVSEEKSMKSASEAADKFDKSIDNAGDSAQDAGKKASISASLFSKLAEVLKNGVVTGVKAAVSAFAAYTTAAATLSSTVASTGLTTFSDFESQMSTVKSLMSGSCKTTEELEGIMSKLTDKAKELGATTKFTATEAGQAMEYMALAGWNVNEIMEGIPGIMNLAAASEMELGQASDIVTDYLTAFGWEANRAGDFVDIMSKAMSTSNTSTADLGEAYKNCAATANSLGYSVEETTAVIATMANAGVKGGEAGTALNAIMTRLATDTKGCASELAEYGVNVYDAQGNMQSLSSILQGASDVWEELTDQQQANLAKTIAGTNQYSALQTIMGGLSEDLEGTGKGFADYAKAFEDCAGTAEKMASIKLDNLKGQLTLLQSSAEGAALTIGGELAPAATEAVKGIKSIFDVFNGKGLDAALKKVSELVKRLVQTIRYELPKILPDLLGDFNKILITLFQSIGTILPALFSKILPIFVDGFLNLSESLTSYISSSLPGLLTNIFSAMQKIGSAMLEKAPLIWNAIQEILKTVLSFFSEHTSDFTAAAKTLVSGLISELVSFLPLLTETILNMLPGLVEVAVQFVASILDGLGKMLPEIVIQIVDIIPQIVDALAAGIPLLLQGAIEFFKAIIDSIPRIIGVLLPALTQIINAVLQALISGIPILIDGALQLLTAIIDAIPLIIPIIAENLPLIVNAIVTGLIGCTNTIVYAAVDLLTGIIRAIPTVIDMLIPQAVTIVKAIITVLAENLPLLLEASITLFMTLLAAVPLVTVELVKIVPSIIGGIVKALIASVGLIVTAVYEIGKAFVDAFIEFFGIHSPSKLMQEKAKFLVDGIVEGIKKMPSAMWDVLQKAYDKVVTWASNIAQKGKDGAKNLFDNVINGIKSLPGQMLSIGDNIVGGLWDGINGAAGWLAKKVKSFASGILDNMKSALGINSPSRVMRDMVGKFIPEGIAAGIDQNAKTAINSMRNLAAQLVPSTDALKMDFNSSLTGAGNSSSSGGSSITQNFYQTNNSPKALSRLEIYRQSKNLLDFAKGVRT